MCDLSPMYMFVYSSAYNNVLSLFWYLLIYKKNAVCQFYAMLNIFAFFINNWLYIQIILLWVIHWTLHNRNGFHIYL